MLLPVCVHEMHIYYMPKLQHYGLNVTGTEVRKSELMSPQQL